jgi:Flp pilus assembly protein TadG
MGWEYVRTRTIRGREDGASLVEFALIMPLLVILLLGVVEFGWGLAQHIDVRHKARETLRQAIVDAPADVIQNQACADDIVRGDDINEISLGTGVEPGSPATVTVSADLRQLTGLFSLFWGPSPTISSTVEGRVEQESTTFNDGSDFSPCDLPPSP